MGMDDKQLKEEQELAKILAGVTDGNGDDVTLDTAQSVTEEAAETTKTEKPEAGVPAMPSVDMNFEVPEPAFVPEAMPSPISPVNELSGNLEEVKQNAINDLRPLVGKLNIPDDEKFDTYLLLIRSTDDTSLIEPAYESARLITDESKKAQALLDIVKEIDYFTAKK